MSENPAALERLMREFLAAEPDARNSGIYAAKTGYHNTRAHHLAGTHGGRTSDYSIKLAVDKRGPSDKAAAVDISFDSARLRSNFAVIAKYSRRLDTACRARDPRLFDSGQPVIREWFGNTDSDRSVEGWTFHRTTDGSTGPASSDSTHLWHIHISFHRAYVENWGAVSGVLDVLLGKPRPTPEDEVTPADIDAIATKVAAILKPQFDEIDRYAKDAYGDLNTLIQTLGTRETNRDAAQNDAIARIEGAAKQIDDHLKQIIGGQP